MTFEFGTGGAVGACWVCGMQIYANKPAAERTFADVFAIVHHVMEQHPQTIGTGVAA